MNQYPLVYLDHVQKVYGKHIALYDVSVNIQPGRIIGLLGPNGSGKTTIIKLVNGLLQPTSGNVYIQLKQLSKGNKEKVQLILVMSREADLYILDEPIGGVDPAARDYILRTIIQNRRPNSSVLISTHLIADVEQVLDEALFINQGRILLHENTTVLRNQYGKSIDEIFREQFRMY